MVKLYPKFLAFLQIFYPSLFQKLSPHSKKSDIVEANLICSNNTHSFQAIVYSEGDTKDGELFNVFTSKNTSAPYSWDWRWVFAVKILYEGNVVFPFKFKQKVIALPTGKTPLTHIFFDILQEEVHSTLTESIKDTNNEQKSVHESYVKYLNSVTI